MRWLSTAGALLLMTLMTPFGLGVAQASQGGDDNKVTVCHRTNSETNPYVVITIDKAAVFKRGHDTHDEGPVWEPGFKAAGKRWGDIIPPFDYYASPKDTEKTRYDGLNWDAAGQAIWNNSCQPTTPPAPEKDKPTGQLEGECVETDGTFRVFGQFTNRDYPDTIWRLSLPGSTIALSSSPFAEVIQAPKDTVVTLQFSTDDGKAWHDADDVKVKDCPVSQPDQPTGSFAAECTATGAQADVGEFDSGDRQGGDFRLTWEGGSAVVTSGQQDVTVPAETLITLVYVPVEGSAIVLDSETSPKACPPPPEAEEEGRIRVVKEIEGDPIGADTDFAVLVTCDDPVYEQEFELTEANRWAAETDLLPDGTVCFVEETDVPDGWNPEGIVTPDEETTEGTGPVKIVVRSEGTGVVTATVTNERRTGRVEIIKRFEGDPAPAGTTFTVLLDCPGTEYDRTGVLTAEKAWTVLFRGIPSGLTCTVSETGIPAGWELVTIQPPSVVIDSFETVTVEVTNKRTPQPPPPPTTGAISVTKVIQGDPSGASTSFTFAVDCDGTAYDQTLTIDVASGTSATRQTGQIPTGTSCTVTEASTPGWTQTSVVPAGGVVAVGGTVTFTNSRVTTPPPVAPESGSLGITKSVTPVAGEGTVVGFGDTLTYTLTVTATGNRTQPNVVVTDYVPGFDPARPQSGKTTYVSGSATCVGTGTCTVTEPGADGLITWRLGDMAGGTSRQVTFQVTIDDVAVDPGEVVAVDILNAGAVTSDVTPTVPSNEVRTTLTKALPVKVGQPKEGKEDQPPAEQPRVLPRTGSGVSLGATAVLGGVLLLMGLALLATARPAARNRAHG